MGGTEDERFYVNFVHLGIRLETKLTPVLVTKLLEQPNKLLAFSEGAALSDGIVEVHGDEISYVDIGRVPSVAFETAVQPINRSIRTSGLGDLFCERFRIERKPCRGQSEGLTSGTVGSAPLILNFDDTVGVGGRVALGRIVV